MNNLLSIIIITYNSSSHINKCLKSIKNNINSDFEVIIVDNNSSDETLTEIKKISGIKVKILPQNQNLGFSRANNIGVKESSGDILLFLNPDTEIKKIDINTLRDYLSNQEVGIVAPKLILDNEKTQPSVLNLPTIKNALLEYWLGQKNKYSQYIPKSDGPTEVEAVYGAALFMKRSTYESINGFDDSYFLYFEDLDLCKKIKQKGMKIIYYPDFVVKHSVGVSSKTNPKTQELFIDSAKKYHGLLKYYVLYLILRLRPFYR